MILEFVAGFFLTLYFKLYTLYFYLSNPYLGAKP